MPPSRQWFKRCDRLISFLAVADTGHFRQAADRLHLTQPPLTRHIQALEQELGVTLFTRTTRQVRLTPAGERLARRLRPCFEEIEAAWHDASAPTDQPCPIAIGMTPAVDDGLLPSRAWLEAHLDQTVDIERQPSSRLLSRLLKDDARPLSLALVGLPITLPEPLECHIVADDPLWVLMSDALAERLGEDRDVDLCRLSDRPLFWFSRRDNPDYFDHCERLFRIHGYQPQRLREPDDHHQLLALVAADEGIALAPQSFLVTQRQGVTSRPLSPRWSDLRTRLALAWNRHDDASCRLAQRLVAALQSN
ncbi:LysR family transcriptional regulator [Halomonas sp. DP8Y7-1]|uniref:LysR family transcriptional regulator n=1 Tax=unclassified Halomonas TaxID=2609666 RepID=UPI001C942316|nr:MULTISPECIES: LysR family transcriptional regulator [unclassified Halomonas]MBY5929013.1 LysR family transcriptional regulator [Halomonas sp. DP8Y7-3]MBY6031296.1 LysR family transcriptional regulator [Halomonas sp. DP8Y7-1]